METLGPRLRQFVNNTTRRIRISGYTLAYHVVVHAMEGRAGLAPLQRFWLALRHAADGQLPYIRYYEAGSRRERDRASAGDVKRWVSEWLSTDLNPAVQALRMSTSMSALIEGYNAYNKSSCGVVRTTMTVSSESAAAAREPVVGRKRELFATDRDPAPCRIGTFEVFDSAVRGLARGEAGPSALLSVDHVSSRLGVEGTATAQAAAVFQSEGNIAVPRLAAQLGSSPRALQRRLREEGGTAEEIRASCRIVAACGLLPSALTLTQIAVDAGYSDLAHMSRAIKAACGLAPSLLRRTASLSGASPLH